MVVGEVMTTLVFSFALIFCIDKYLLLRGTSVMMYTSNKLAKNFSRLFAFPTACLAGITAWWGVRSTTGVCTAQLHDGSASSHKVRAGRASSVSPRCAAARTLLPRLQSGYPQTPFTLQRTP